MEQSRIRELLDLYFEGQTTLEQERAIKDFFATTQNIPADLAPYKAMFAAFDASALERSDTMVPRIASRPSWQVLLGGISAISAAACLLLALFIWSGKRVNEPTIICYVDGVEITDTDRAVAEAQRILSGVNNDVELAMATIEKVNIFELK